MKRWYERRIEVRDVLAACGVSALLAATLSWLIFVWVGPGAEKFATGSLGDWAAATGTIVIGYGAWKYAAATFLLQRQQLAQEEARIKKQTSAQIRSVETWAGLLIRPMSHVSECMSRVDDEGRISLATLCGTVAGSRNIIDVIRWDETSWNVLEDDGSEAKISALTVARNFDHMCEVFLTHHKGKVDLLRLNEIPGLTAIVTACRELDKAGRSVAVLAQKAKDEAGYQQDPLPTPQPLEAPPSA